MAGEAERVHVRAAGAPHRCPFCHADVDHDRDRWVACRACLARHHEACWAEGAGCAGCGAALSIAPPAPAASPAPGLPVLTVTLHRRTRTTASVDVLGRLLVRPGRDEAFALAVRNATESAQHVELRKLPPWLQIEGPASADVAAGATACFRLVIVDAALPTQRSWVGGGGDQGLPSLSAIVRGVAGTFVVSGDDDAETVELRVSREASLRLLVGVGVLGGLMMWPLGGALVVGSLLMLAKALIVRWRIQGDDLDAAFARRVARANVRAALVVLPVLSAMIGALVLLLTYLGAPR